MDTLYPARCGVFFGRETIGCQSNPEIPEVAT